MRAEAMSTDVLPIMTSAVWCWEVDTSVQFSISAAKVRAKSTASPKIVKSGDVENAVRPGNQVANHSADQEDFD